jgi:predicted ATPase
MPEVLSFPAAQLFVERVTAGGDLQKVSEADATLIGGICGKLDGIPLAIELVAGRALAYGFSGTAALLDNRLRLLWQGRRTAPPRHRTLTATLDWSYNLLTEVEREVLCRLSIFAGTFTLEAVQSVVPGEDINRPDVIEALASLVAKSLVALESNDPAARYRLLDTTRTYLLEKLTGRGGRDDVARRLATFVREALQHARGKASDLSKTQKVAAYAGLLDNTRTALQYAFASGSDPKQSVIMAAEAAPLFLELSLLTECHHWSQKGIEALDDSTRGTPFELELQVALAFSAMFTGGNSDDVRVKFSRGLELAETLQDLYNEMRLLGGLHIILHRIGDFLGALELAQRSMAVATQIGDPAAIAIAHSMLGVAQHLAGDHANARINCEAALKLPSSSPRINTMNFGFDHRNRVQIVSTRNYWLQGFPDKAVDAARRTIAEATALRHPVTLGISLIWTVPVFLWIGDWRSADDHVEQLMTIAGQHSLAVHQAFGLGLRGELSVKRGEAKIGIELLRGSLEALHKSNYEMRTTGLTSALAEGMAMVGRLDEALQTIDAAIARVERAGDHFYMPELLRLKGGILAAANGTDLAIVEACLAESLDLARRQSALGWELRSATSLARWLRSQGRLEGSHILAPVYERFTEGFGTADLRAAREVLERME